MKNGLIALLMLLALNVQAANIEVYQFDDPAKEATYKSLIHELRCLVCQNQPISDSNAELAQDMRRKTYQLVSKGMDEDEVTDYMRQRYGDFVSYKPPFNATTVVLWIGPFVLLLLALWLMLRTIRARRASDETTRLDQAKLREAAELLNQKDKS